MFEIPGLPSSLGEVGIDLLDPNSGRPIKSWTFRGKSQITIGRSPDQDIEVSDPYVSRNHAQIVHRDSAWILISLGRNGVIVSNKLVNDFPLEDETSFKLGAEGPMLQFRTSFNSSASATIGVDTSHLPIFQIDNQKVQAEVSEITEGDYFQNLQKRARQLRGQR